MSDLKNKISRNSSLVRATIDRALIGEGYSETLIEAMKYTALSGGKFVRPFLVCEFYKLCGCLDDKYLNFAAAIEMVHAYSLIHDDLPCMDNDSIRRGKPSNHRVNGEAGAILAGDALLTKAFYMIASSDFSSEARIDAVKTLSYFAGPDGMVGGQMLDIESVPSGIGNVMHIYRGKTAALFGAAASLGVIAAGGDDKMLKAAGEYGIKIGLAFQIIDDLLDILGDGEYFGKPIGSDALNGKVTSVSFLGLKEAREYAEKLTLEAVSALPDGENSATLKELGQYLLERAK